MGTRVSATNSEAKRDTATVRARPRETLPAMPAAKNIGRKTATVVKVEAVIAPPTSLVPSMAASKRPLPPSMCRKMFSMTIMALLTSIPTPRAMPLMVMTLRVKSKA